MNKLVNLFLLIFLLSACSRNKEIVVEDFIGWEVTYITGKDKTITELIPSYRHTPNAGYLHFYCKNGDVDVYLLWSLVVKVEAVYGSTSSLSARELLCVEGNKEAMLMGLGIS